MTIAADFVGSIAPYGASLGIVGAVAFVLRLLVHFQRDFTDRYAVEVARQAAQIATLEERLSSQAKAHDAIVEDERFHRTRCESSLAEQALQLAELRQRIAQLDRRQYPTDSPEAP